jgi:mRNA-degrading endonuclease RelE of RelBE toxin-antitoxin system
LTGILELKWTVELSGQARKAFKALSPKAHESFYKLVQDLKEKGPILPEWQHYSEIHTQSYHCHLKRGKPTYVAFWRVVDKRAKIIEVYYAGTHEKAPY